MKSNYPQQKKRPGNGLSRTAMVFKIATIAKHTLSPRELNLVKNINPRSLERVYEGIVAKNDPSDAKFALNLLLQPPRSI